MAWKQLLDAFIEDWNKHHKNQLDPYQDKEDYQKYIDGKSRLEGLQSFLKSRNIELPMGQPTDREGYRVIRQDPGPGYQHVVTADEVTERLSELPQCFLEPLEAVRQGADRLSRDHDVRLFLPRKRREARR